MTTTSTSTTSTSKTTSTATAQARTRTTTGIAQRIGRAAQLVGVVAVTVSAILLPALPASAQTVTTTTATTAPVEQQVFAGSLWATLALENTAGFTAPAFHGNLFALSGPFAKTRGAVIRFHTFQPVTLGA